MLLAANSMKPSALRVVVLPLFHLCLVKIVPSIVVIVSRPSDPLVPPAGMITAIVVVVTMAAVAVVVVVIVIAATVGSTGHLMPERIRTMCE
jgi:multisubunit Na+/H+ antiporter MnhC subunit